MKAVDKILATIQESIETGIFLDVETDKVEIKDLERAIQFYLRFFKHRRWYRYCWH